MTQGETALAAGERFMPDCVIGLAARLALAPGLWIWGRSLSGPWPSADSAAIAAAERWPAPFMASDLTAAILVWGAQLTALLLALGFLTRLVGLGLLAACAVYASWIAPEAWTSAAAAGALAFYLFARGGGALSIDGAIVATTR